MRGAGAAWRGGRDDAWCCLARGGVFVMQAAFPPRPSGGSSCSSAPHPHPLFRAPCKTQGESPSERRRDRVCSSVTMGTLGNSPSNRADIMWGSPEARLQLGPGPDGLVAECHRLQLLESPPSRGLPIRPLLQPLGFITGAVLLASCPRGQAQLGLQPGLRGSQQGVSGGSGVAHAAFSLVCCPAALSTPSTESPSCPIPSDPR